MPVALGTSACSAARPLAGSSAAIAATGCCCRWGYERELRLALVDGFTCWGARCSASQDPPTSADARGGLRIGQVPDAVSVDTTAEGPGLMIRDDELEIPPSRLTPSAGSKSFRMSGQDYRIRSGRSRPACGKWRTLTARKTKRRARGEGPVAGW